MSILVLLSTYNGEKYLREQLDSILNQKGVDVNVLVRDDGSKDYTWNILSEYSNKNRNIEVLSGTNKGYIGSFTELVLYAKEKYEVPYYAFADQDDIWCEDKLITATNALIKEENTQPVMWCCNSRVIDKDGKELFIMRRDNLSFTRGNALYCCKIQGCAMVFNQSALRKYAEGTSANISHDTWMFYVCNFFGKILYEHQPYIKYRIHANNAIGSSVSKSWVQTWKTRLKNWKTNKHNYFINSAKCFLDAYSENLCDDDKKMINVFITYKQSVCNKQKMIFCKEFGTTSTSLKDKFLFVYHVLTNQI